MKKKGMKVFYSDSEEFKIAEEESKNDTYMIVGCNSLLDLTQSINKKMKEGWTPIGSFQNEGHGIDIYYQTLIKE